MSVHAYRNRIRQNRELNTDGDVRETTPAPSKNVVTAIYFVGIIMWIIFIVILKLYKGIVGLHKGLSILAVFIIAIPLAVFLLGIFNSASSATISTELVGSTYLSSGLLVIAALLTWVSKDYTGDREQFVSVMVIGIFLLLLSTIDIWVRDSWVFYLIHIRSVIETMGLVLILFTLHLYLSNYDKAMEKGKKGHT